MVTYRGRIISFDSQGNLRDFHGYISVENGIIKKISVDKPEGDYVDYSEHLILPGFIDTHVHLPQVNIRAKWSDNLLKWLETYVFPEEIRFLDEEYTRRMADRFFTEMARNGTTTALVYGPPSRESTDVAFEVAEERGVRTFMGQTLMDMNVPDELVTDAETAVEDVKVLAKKWKKDKVDYVLTIRFAPACSMELMKKTGEIAKKMGLRIQTHISEQIEEIELVNRIFKDGYANVYDRAGLLYHRTVLAHGIHLTPEELKLISQRNAKIAHCPSSNFFLHSGIMSVKKMRENGIEVALGSDIAGGAYINMLNVMRDAYYANPLSPSEILKMLTIGGARVLGLQNVGTLEAGKDADFVVVKYEEEKSTEELLADLIFYGGENSIIATYSRGKRIWGT